MSTNAYLRKAHNFAVDMNWLPATVIPKRQWPPIRFREKRAITLAEHQKIIAAEVNPERKTLYQLCWHLGARQGDIAALKGEDVDWTNNTVGFFRKKTGVRVPGRISLSVRTAVRMCVMTRAQKGRGPLPIRATFLLDLRSRADHYREP